MYLYLLRYVIKNDFDEGEHRETAKGIRDEYKENAVRVSPATWLVKTNDIPSAFREKIVAIIKAAKVGDNDYRYIITPTSKSSLMYQLYTSTVELIDKL